MAGEERPPAGWQWRYRIKEPVPTEWSTWFYGRAPDLPSGRYEAEERPLYLA